MDLFGPVDPPTPEGHVYVLGMVDDHSKYVEVVPLTFKSEVRAKVKEVLVKWETQRDVKVQRIRIDRGTEFLTNELREFLVDKGIVHELTAPYTPQQNGVAERFNRTVKEKARCMILDAALPAEFWGEAVVTPCFLRNISHVKGKSCTPWELFTNNVPDVSALRVFGCRAYVKQEKKSVGTFDAQSLPGIFLGYAPTSKAYKVLVDGKIVISRNVTFCENSVGLPEIGEDLDELNRITELHRSSHLGLMRWRPNGTKIHV